MVIRFDGTLSDWLFLILISVILIFCCISNNQKVKLSHDDRQDIDSGLHLLLGFISDDEFKFKHGFSESDIEHWKQDIENLKEKINF